jgi:hypothetical protein
VFAVGNGRKLRFDARLLGKPDSDSTLPLLTLSVFVLFACQRAAF